MHPVASAITFSIFVLLFVGAGGPFVAEVIEAAIEGGLGGQWTNGPVVILAGVGFLVGCFAAITAVESEQPEWGQFWTPIKKLKALGGLAGQTLVAGCAYGVVMISARQEPTQNIVAIVIPHSFLHRQVYYGSIAITLLVILIVCLIRIGPKKSGAEADTARGQKAQDGRAAAEERRR